MYPSSRKWSEYKRGFKRACRREHCFGFWDTKFLGLPVYYNLRPLNFPVGLNRINFTVRYIEACFLILSLPIVLSKILLWRFKNPKGSIVSIASNRLLLKAFSRQVEMQDGILVLSDGQLDHSNHRSVDARSINLIRAGVIILAGYFSVFFCLAVRQDMRRLCRIYGTRNVAFSLGDIVWFFLIKFLLPSGVIFFSNFLVPKVAKFSKDGRFEEIQHGVIDRFHWDYSKVPNIKSTIHFYSEENAKMCNQHKDEFDFDIKLFASSVEDQISSVSPVDFLIFCPGPNQIIDEKICEALVNVLAKHGSIAIKEHPRVTFSSPVLVDLITKGSTVPDFKVAICGISSIYFDWSDSKDVCVLFDGLDDMGAFEAGILPEQLRPHNIPVSIIEELENLGLYVLNDFK